MEAVVDNIGLVRRITAEGTQGTLAVVDRIVAVDSRLLCIDLVL